MKGRIDNKMGSIQIDPEVIAMYAGTTAVECFGIVGMAAVSMKDGLVRLLKRESLTHGINVAIKDNAHQHRFPRDRGIRGQHLDRCGQPDRERKIQSRRVYWHEG